MDTFIGYVQDMDILTAFPSKSRWIKTGKMKPAYNKG